MGTLLEDQNVNSCWKGCFHDGHADYTIDQFHFEAGNRPFGNLSENTDPSTHDLKGWK